MIWSVLRRSAGDRPDRSNLPGSAGYEADLVDVDCLVEAVSRLVDEVCQIFKGQQPPHPGRNRRAPDDAHR